jgi:hypothetical protein
MSWAKMLSRVRVQVNTHIEGFEDRWNFCLGGEIAPAEEAALHAQI